MYPRMASLYISGLLRMPFATTTDYPVSVLKERKTDDRLFRISEALDMLCSNTRATEENKHELSSGTIL